uniref:Uncharacterized protein n=2 Tax=Caenorhabditis japonica TaxID=281687 RepID=A0A8R1EKY9_CAEJA
KRFVGQNYKTLMQLPLVNNIPCEHHSGVFYNATEAMRVQKKKLAEQKELNPRLSPKAPLLHWLRIRFEPQESLSFVACQLIRCVRKINLAVAQPSS